MTSKDQMGHNECLRTDKWDAIDATLTRLDKTMDKQTTVLETISAQHEILTFHSEQIKELKEADQEIFPRLNNLENFKSRVEERQIIQSVGASDQKDSLLNMFKIYFKQHAIALLLFCTYTLDRLDISVKLVQWWKEFIR